MTWLAETPDVARPPSASRNWKLGTWNPERSSPIPAPLARLSSPVRYVTLR